MTTTAGPLRVAICTLGCKVNQADGTALLLPLQGQVRLVSFKDRADIYIINSCTVTAVADRQSRQLVYQARRRNPDAMVVLCGCLAAVYPVGASTIPGVDRIFSPTESAALVSLVREAASDRDRDHDRDRDRNRAPQEHQSGPARARPFLKVQDGCSNACSFCIVPRARGPSRTTREPAAVREALAGLARQGFSEVVLTGIHLGRYGLDLDPPVSLPELLESCVGLVPRLRLSSVEPLELDQRLMGLLANSDGAICPHLHVPIQSGDDRILEAMNRPYRSAAIRELLGHLRRCSPEMALGTDLIVGFPGETEAQFEATLELVQRSSLTHLHVFSYSPRPATRAVELLQERLVAPVPRETIRRRAARLRLAGLEKLRAFAGAQLGTTRAVLVERRLDDGLMAGVTDNYLRVTFPGQTSWVRKLVSVELLSVEEGGGEVVLRGGAA